MPTYFAHGGKLADKSDWQLLTARLSNVANLARSFAEPFRADSWAYAAGMAHDQGKATDAFQARLAGSPDKVDHSTAGAKLLSEAYDMKRGIQGAILPQLVLGHHGGLPNYGRSAARTAAMERLASYGQDPKTLPYADMLHAIQDMTPFDGILEAPRKTDRAVRRGGGAT